jgi:hypothetical protein
LVSHCDPSLSPRLCAATSAVTRDILRPAGGKPRIDGCVLPNRLQHYTAIRAEIFGTIGRHRHAIVGAGSKRRQS